MDGQVLISPQCVYSTRVVPEPIILKTVRLFQAYMILILTTDDLVPAIKRIILY
jgi:hypothetical protein